MNRSMFTRVIFMSGDLTPSSSLWNQERCDITFRRGTYSSVDNRGRSASGHCEEREEGGLWNSSAPVKSPTSQCVLEWSRAHIISS